VNLIETMSKREIWEQIKREDQTLAELITAASQRFGKVELVEYEKAIEGTRIKDNPVERVRQK
jgi:hypothetical protein